MDFICWYPNEQISSSGMGPPITGTGPIPSTGIPPTGNLLVSSIYLPYSLALALAALQFGARIGIGTATATMAFVSSMATVPSARAGTDIALMAFFFGMGTCQVPVPVLA